MLYTYQLDNKTYTVNLERQPDGTYRARIASENGTPREYHFSANPTANGWQLLTDDARNTAYTAAQNDKRFVSINDSTFEVSVEQKTRKKRGASSDTGGASLTAQMPGQVRALLVAAGDTVTRGQTLLVLEAMKMEIRVSAPQDGTISRINVREGDVVERGQTLIDLTP